MLPPPPTSTLFPYTTLFRSPQSTFPTDRRSVKSGSAASASKQQEALRSNFRHSPTGDPPVKIFASAASVVSMVDRKSTRLNSSHMSISYAVFCLKKKKTSKDFLTIPQFFASSCPTPPTHSFRS